MANKHLYTEKKEHVTKVALTSAQFKKLDTTKIPKGWAYWAGTDRNKNLTHWIRRKWTFCFETDVIPKIPIEEIYNMAAVHYPVAKSITMRNDEVISKMPHLFDDIKPTKVNMALSKQSSDNREKVILGLLKQKKVKNRKEAIELCDTMGI